MAIQPPSFRSSNQWSIDKTSHTAGTFNEQCPLSSLPDKLICKILNKLPDSGKSASQTCKKIRAIFAQNKKCAKWIDPFDKSLPPLSSRHFPNICQFTFQNASKGQSGISQLIRDFSIVKWRFVNCQLANDIVLARLSVSTTLRSLILQNCPHFTDTGLAALLISQSPLPPISPLTTSTHWGLDALTHLHVIDCHALSGSWFGFLPAYLPKVRYLNVSGCIHLTDVALGALLRGAPSLTHLSADSCAHFSGMHLNIGQTLTSQLKLAHLHLAFCDSLTDSGLQYFARRGVELTYLSLRQCSKISDVGLLALRSSALAHCNLSGCIGVSDGGLRAFLRSTSQLKKLFLNDCKQLSDQTLNQLLTTRPELYSLGLENCHRIQKIGLSQYSPYLPQLRALALSGCVGLTDSGFGKLARNAPQLEMVDISYCAGLEGDFQVRSALPWNWLRAVGIRLNGKALAKILGATPSLTHLDIGQATNIHELPMWLLTRSLKNLRELHLCGLDQLKSQNLKWIGHFPQISVLDLSGCSQLDNGTLKAILSNLHKLQHLELQQCDQLTDDCMNFENRHLELLNLRDNNWLTDKGLQLLSSLSVLKVVNLQNCMNVTFHGVDALQQQIPALSIESAHLAEDP